jgi:hypothetical protein
MRGKHRVLALALGLAAVAALLVTLPPPSRAQTLPPEEGRVSGAADAPVSESSDGIAETVDRGLRVRARSLYAYLQGKRVNIYSLYQSEIFRDFFTTEAALQNYIAHLTARLSARRFRKYRIERTELLGVTQTGPGQAEARVKLIGRHRQPFLFWDKTETVVNEWRQMDGEWFVFPPPF